VTGELAANVAQKLVWDVEHQDVSPAHSLEQIRHRDNVLGQLDSRQVPKKKEENLVLE